MPKLFHCLPLLVSSLVPLLSGCLDPSFDVAGGSVFPEQPPPDKPYQCGSNSGKPCANPRVRVWVPGWHVVESAARGDKVAFVAYPCFPTGGRNSSEPMHLGQVDLKHGTIDWMVKLGTNRDDVFSVYHLTTAPNGDVIVAGTGYGELLLGVKGDFDDGFVASFDTFGKKRFAKATTIIDGQPSPGYSTGINNLRIIANDTIYVQTSHQISGPNQVSSARIHIFAFKLDGTQLFRQEVPTSTSTYNGTTWPVPDGSMWIKKFYGEFRRYSQAGEMLDTFELAPDADMRGFAAMSPKTMLINLTTKGLTNEMYRFDFGAPMVPLFSENTFPEIHAAEINHSLGFAQTYMVSLGYSAIVHRIQSIDVNGNRGAATTVKNVLSRFTILDSEEAVLARYTDFGTEFIVQPL